MRKRHGEQGPALRTLLIHSSTAPITGAAVRAVETLVENTGSPLPSALDKHGGSCTCQRPGYMGCCCSHRGARNIPNPWVFSPALVGVTSAVFLEKSNGEVSDGTFIQHNHSLKTQRSTN